MDFFAPTVINTDRGAVIKPMFFNKRNIKDIMIRGKSFYAIWDEETNMWSRNELLVSEVVDRALDEKKVKASEEGFLAKRVEYMSQTMGGQTNSFKVYLNWLRDLPDIYHPLDTKVTYLSQETTKKDYASKRVPYDLDPADPDAYNELMSTLYDPKERRKLEWAVGAVLNGDAKSIQKMLVLYGPPGSGKSTFLHILEQLLTGYWTTFDAKSLTSSASSFSTHFFSENPLVAIQHDGQLSKIEDNSLLNSIVSHEDIVVNEKFKPQYTDRANCMLFLGTNSPVKISDSKSGLIRRLIDVNPSGRKVETQLYYDLMDRIPFELGRIANHCLKVYRHFGKRYYDDYRPLSMMYATDVFFNFVADNRLLLENDDPMELDRIFAIYKDYCEKTNASFISQRYRFREELENYYERYDKSLKSFFGFKSHLLDEQDFEEVQAEAEDGDRKVRWIVLDVRESIFDKECSSCLAQYGNKDEIPFDKWENVTRTLKEIDTNKLHYVKVPENHIVIDFDLKNEKGEKDAKLNLDAANKFPPTYAEYSKGGSGLHLHYIWGGDLNSLSRIYSERGIEVKVFTGGSSLRRKLTLCNNLPIAHISSGLPLKEDKKMINMDVVKDEQHLRNLIKKCLRKEIHAYTKPSIDYIYKLLEDFYVSGRHYDVRDLRQKILTFAMGSTNQKDACLKLVNQMHFCSEEASEAIANDDAPIVFYDIEIFPNLFIICWKYKETDDVIKMINPSSKEVGELFKFRLIGFNNRRYDNHLIYARYIGYTNEQLFSLSQKIIGKKTGGGFFGEAYNLSYADVYDFCAKKQSLKKWEIELGIHHQENSVPWDQPVPENRWLEIADYCANDVIATQRVFEANYVDFETRLAVSKLSGLTPNDTNLMHAIAFMFGKEKKPILVHTKMATGEQSEGR